MWQQVIASKAEEVFQADAQGAAYLQSLQQIFRVALLVQHAAELHTDALPPDAAFAEAREQSLVAVQGEAISSLPQNFMVVLLCLLLL